MSPGAGESRDDNVQRHPCHQAQGIEIDACPQLLNRVAMPSDPGRQASHE